MKIKTFLFFIILFVLLSTIVVLAQSNNGDTIQEMKDAILDIGCWIIKFLFYIVSAVSAVVIVLAGVKYATADSPDERCEARDRIKYAVIGLMVVMISCTLVNYFISETKIAKIPEGCCPLFSPSASPNPSSPTPEDSKDIFEILGGLICQIIAGIYYIVSAIAAIVILYAGLKYVSADGSGAREEAKVIVTQAIIGLVIVLIAVPLVNYFTDPYSMLNCGSYLGASETSKETPPDNAICVKITNKEECKKSDCGWCEDPSATYESFNCFGKNVCANFCDVTCEEKEQLAQIECTNPDGTEGQKICIKDDIGKDWTSTCENGQWVNRYCKYGCENGECLKEAVSQEICCCDRSCSSVTSFSQCAYLPDTKSCKQLEGHTCSSDKCCTKKTCTDLNKECGSWSDDCGGTVNCGTCQSGETCENGECLKEEEPPPVKEEGNLEIKSASGEPSSPNS